MKINPTPLIQTQMANKIQPTRHNSIDAGKSRSPCFHIFFLSPLTVFPFVYRFSFHGEPSVSIYMYKSVAKITKVQED